MDLQEHPSWEHKPHVLGGQQRWYLAALHPETLCPMMLPLKSMMVPRRVALGLPGWRSPSIPGTQDRGWGPEYMRSKALPAISIGMRGEQQDLASVLAQAGNHPILPPLRCIPGDRLQNPVMLRAAEARALWERLLPLPFPSRARRTSPARSQGPGPRGRS